MTLIAGADDGGRRLDRILRKALPDMPLSGIHRLLRKGRILVDGRAARGEDRIAAGSVITIPEAPETLKPRPSLPALPVRGNAPAAVLREEAGLIFLNKPAGLAVHGAGSLDTQVRAWLEGTLPPSLSFRPGPLHRLDKPTSGIIVFSRTLEGARYFSALLREGRIKKQYLAIVEGALRGPELWDDLLIRDKSERKTFPAGAGDGPEPPDSKTVDTAKYARTQVRPLALSPGFSRRGGGEEIFSLILAEIETGRTHQIRAQAAARGFPLAGDAKYGGRPQAGGFLLHAWKLELPASGGEQPRTVTAPLPERFRLRLEELFGKDIPELVENL
jgi:23S rRNA pseudouridine955/2504/2580 synthase